MLLSLQKAPPHGLLAYQQGAGIGFDALLELLSKSVHALRQSLQDAATHHEGASVT